MKIRRLHFIVLIALFLSATAAAQTGTPLAAATAFYKYDRSHPQIFNRRQIEARRQWFSDDLYRLFQYELKREAAYLKKNLSDKPFFGDGLPFQPIDETCEAGKGKTHKVLKLSQKFYKGRRGSVEATFAFPKPCPDPDRTVYTLHFVQGKRGWVIDDVSYGGESDHTLKQDLNRKDY